uniref:Uncharacterized protein n=1 Tax=viral metagenome TaxID=1070528 RepID=A0A6C0I809_9ZZZZ
MDDLICSFEKLNSPDEIDELITKINNISIVDHDFEWKQLKTNYNQLKYFKQVSLQLEMKILIKPFLAFMEKIDELNRYYLSVVNFDPAIYEYELQESIIDISNKLNESVNTFDPFKKLDIVLYTYKVILQFVTTHTHLL